MIINVMPLVNYGSHIPVKDVKNSCAINEGLVCVMPFRPKSILFFRALGEDRAEHDSPRAHDRSITSFRL